MRSFFSYYLLKKKKKRENLELFMFEGTVHVSVSLWVLTVLFHQWWDYGVLFGGGILGRRKAFGESCRVNLGRY